MQKLISIVGENAHLSPKEQKFLNFRLKCILYDVSKLILFLAFFAAIHKLDYFVYAFIIFYPIRQISGGLHFKHYISCALFSFIYLCAVIILLAPVKLEFMVVIPILAVCAVIVYATGPIRPPSRPPLSAVETAQHRKKAFIIICYDITLTVLFFQTELAPVGYWTIILHTMQLLIAYILRKGGETHAVRS